MLNERVNNLNAKLVSVSPLLGAVAQSGRTGSGIAGMLSTNMSALSPPGEENDLWDVVTTP